MPRGLAVHRLLGAVQRKQERVSQPVIRWLPSAPPASYLPLPCQVDSLNPLTLRLRLHQGLSLPPRAVLSRFDALALAVQHAGPPDGGSSRGGPAPGPEF